MTNHNDVITVKALLDKLQALANECINKQATIIFEVPNQPDVKLILQEASDVEPAIRPGCGCWDGTCFCLTVTTGFDTNIPDFPLQQLLDRLSSLNTEIGCDGERIASHKTSSAVNFHVRNEEIDWSLELEGIELQKAEAVGGDKIVFRLTAIAD